VPLRYFSLSRVLRFGRADIVMQTLVVDLLGMARGIAWLEFHFVG